MGKRLNALPEVVEQSLTLQDGSPVENQEIVTLGDEPPLDDRPFLARSTVRQNEESRESLPIKGQHSTEQGILIKCFASFSYRDRILSLSLPASGRFGKTGQLGKGSS